MKSLKLPRPDELNSYEAMISPDSVELFDLRRDFYLKISSSTFPNALASRSGETGSHSRICDDAFHRRRPTESRHANAKHRLDREE